MMPYTIAAEAGTTAVAVTRTTGMARSGSVEDEGDERVAAGCQHVLLAIEHVGLRRIRDAAEPRVPQWLPVRRVEARRGCRRRRRRRPAGQPWSTSRVAPPPPVSGWRQTTFAGLRIDRRHEISRRHASTALHAAETHRSARIGVDQVSDRQIVVLADIEEPGVRRVRGRRPVRRAAADDRRQVPWRPFRD